MLRTAGRGGIRQGGWYTSLLGTDISLREVVQMLQILWDLDLAHKSQPSLHRERALLCLQLSCLAQI